MDNAELDNFIARIRRLPKPPCLTSCVNLRHDAECKKTHSKCASHSHCKAAKTACPIFWRWVNSGSNVGNGKKQFGKDMGEMTSEEMYEPTVETYAQVYQETDDE